MLTRDKNSAKMMVVVRCLILCSEFTKNCLLAGLCPELIALPPSWIMGEGRGKGDGTERRGKESGRERREWGYRIPPE